MAILNFQRFLKEYTRDILFLFETLKKKGIFKVLLLSQNLSNFFGIFQVCINMSFIYDKQFKFL